MKRIGSLIRLLPEKYQEYKALHAAVWPEILAKITCYGIRNYSIYHKDGFLFSYFEYVGSNFDADMAKMTADPKIRNTRKKLLSESMPSIKKGLMITYKTK